MTTYSAKDLQEYLQSLEGAPYQQLRGLLNTRYILRNVSSTIEIVSIQPDPFAPGSQIKLVCQLDAMGSLHLPVEGNNIRTIAATDYLLRVANKVVVNSGIEILHASQHVIQRSALVLLSPTSFELRQCVSLPGNGRRIDSRGCLHVLLQKQEEIAAAWNAISIDNMKTHIQSVCDQEELRGALPEHGLVGFVCNGAILPRSSGHVDTPLSVSNGAIPFQSPPSLEYTITLSSGKVLTGMGIRPGVTVITGGGFHGKSTVLRALELGVYNHIPGDGREFVVAHESAVKVCAEDRRPVTGVDISGFVRTVPGMGRDATKAFSTQQASGSTSQSANIVEALELGSTLLLVDEDTSATNLMIRDELIALLVKEEPITPFVSRVQELYRTLGVSTIIVVGGSGQYLRVGDVILGMVAYRPHDFTEATRNLLASNGSLSLLPPPPEGPFQAPTPRMINLPESFHMLNDERVRVRAGKDNISLGGPDYDIDMSSVNQVVEGRGQMTYIAQVICSIMSIAEGTKGATTAIAVDSIARRFDNVTSMDLQGGRVKYFPKGFSVAVRRFEIAAAFNR
eukprot:PhF_6_TR13558/c0_g1_i1/m.21673